MSANGADGQATKTINSTEFFESIGQKASQLNGTAGDAAAEGQQDGDDEPKVVEQIESLCMNCHENVRAHSPIPRSAPLLSSGHG